MREAVSETDEWYTPPDYFKAMGCQFDLDPCSPSKNHWVPARKVYTKEDDGLSKKWEGFVFMNPPFGPRHGHLPWLEMFILHGNGIGIVSALTSSGWFHDYIPRVDCLLYPRGKTKFIRADGSIGKAPQRAVVLIGMGNKARCILRHSRLGLYQDNHELSQLKKGYSQRGTRMQMMREWMITDEPKNWRLMDEWFDAYGSPL